jgi:hypothetical protein
VLYSVVTDIYLFIYLFKMNEKRNTCMLLVGEPEGKRPLSGPRHRRVDNIKVDLGEMGRWYSDWIGLAQNREN